MADYYDMALESASYIESKLICRPDIAVMLGSGMGDVLANLGGRIDIPYSDIPNFPSTSVKGHKGKLTVGMLADKCVFLMSGRYHYYEGHDIKRVVFPVWVMKLLKIKVLIVANAAGGINPGFRPGDIMLVNDHIGFLAPSALRGRNDERLGTRFPDLSQAYDADLLCMARKTATEYGISVHEGIYAYTKGPVYETPAEIRALRSMGADAVGMSTVPEVTAAVHTGIRVLGISCISNTAAGIEPYPLDHKEVLENVQKAAGNIGVLISEFIRSFKC